MEASSRKVQYFSRAPAAGSSRKGQYVPVDANGRAAPPSPPSGSSRKGQYFSFDAIMAAFIFILAMSLLAGHWFSLRAQMDARSDQLASDAFRLSDLLLGVGDPISYGAPNDVANWYADPSRARRAGFAVNRSLPIELNRTVLEQIDSRLGADQYDASHGALYDAYRGLMSLPSDFLITINVSAANPYAVDADRRTLYYAFGRAPLAPVDVAEVHRAVYLRDERNTDPAQLPDYYGNLTIYIWTNKSRMG